MLGAFIERFINMATISRLKPGQIVYNIVSQRMGNTTISRKCLQTIKIISVDVESGCVEAIRDGHIPRKYRRNDIKKWRVNKPELKLKIFGMSSY